MGYIFESEIESIKNIVRGRTIGESGSITLGEVLASNIHPAIKAYFKAEVEKLLQQERLQEIRSKKFPYSLPEVASLQRQTDILLTHYYQFDQDEFEALLDQAVHFQFNYLCRPQWTLMNFLFENQRHVPTADIERKLRYCADYSYYGEIIKRYIIERGLAEVAYEEFKSLLEKIDSLIIAQHSSKELAKMTRPLIAFVEAGLPVTRAKDAEPTLPINAAIVFFEDKNLTAIQNQLEEERDRSGVTEITIRQLANIIERVLPPREEVEKSEVPEVKEANLEASKKEIDKKYKAAENETNLASTIEQMSSISSGEQNLSGIDDEDLQVAELKPIVLEENQKLEAEDIYSLFSPADQKLFIRKIFKKNELAFHETLDALNNIRTWEEASLFLDQMFMTHNVDPFSKGAIQFTDKIFAYYHPPRNAASAQVR